MVSMILLVISILLALIIDGFLEKIFTALAGILFYQYCIIQWQQWRWRYKKYLIGVFVGYIFVLFLILSFEYRIKDQTIAANFVANEKTAVILVLEGEPPNYNLSKAIRNCRLKNKWGLLHLPFSLYLNKIAYGKINSINTDYYYDYFEEEFKKESNDEYPIYIAYLYNRPYLKEALQEVMKQGNDQLLIIPLLLTESHSFQLVNEVIKEINPLQYRVKIKNTFPLWDSEALAYSFVNKISQNANLKEKNRIGVVLVGNYDLKDINSKQYIKQEVLFLEKMKDMLIKEGYLEAQIRVTPLIEEDIEMELEKLFEYGIKEIMVMQVASATENIDTRLIIDQAIKKTDIPQHVNINFISGWLYNNTLVVELIKRMRVSNMQYWD